MLGFLPAPLCGLIALALFALNLIFGFILVLTIFIIEFIIPLRRWRAFWNKILMQLPTLWIKNNDFIKKLTCKTKFQIVLPSNLSTNQFYLAVSNHTNWADIMVLFSVFDRKIPMLKFFPKKELIWVPCVGLGCWIYGFPFIHRHTKKQLQAHPEWKGRDFAATRKACERFKTQPGTIMLFPEGTRFTKEKHDRQHSAYDYLLKPKAGGTALALQCIEEIDTLLDVTIVYPRDQKSFWQYCCGKAKTITINVDAVPITPELRGDYENDNEYRARFQQFMNNRWKIKDRIIRYTYEHIDA